MPSVKIFQASPLGFVRRHDGVFFPFKSLDLEAEQIAITRALQNTNLRPDFEIATRDSFSRFNVETRHRFLHISCHGWIENDNTYLLFENGFGGADEVSEALLGKWMNERSVESKLSVVFVSACHSRKIGQLFIDSGVSHVVCSGTPDQSLHNTACRLFADHFYQHLAHGHGVKKAFAHARAAVGNSLEMEQSGVKVADEVDKFVLLPEDDQSDEDTSPFPLLPPSPPEQFFGRQEDMYHIVKALSQDEKSLVEIKGSPGIGKNALARAVGDYMVSRNMCEVIWLHTLMHRCGVSIDDHLDTDGNILESTHKLVNHIGQQVKALLGGKHVKILVMLDTKGIGETTIERLGKLVAKMIEANKNIKFLVLYAEDTAKTASNLPKINSKVVSIGPLLAEDMLGLFIRHYTLKNPEAKCLSTTQMKDNYELLKKVLGEGIPAKTIFAAENISDSEYQALFSGKPSQDVFEELLTKMDNYYQTLLHQTAPRSQIEVQEHFDSLLTAEPKVYIKCESAYLRRAKKGEIITTVIGGRKETENEVKDDTSWVARGKLGEFYVLTQTDFEESYDQIGKPIHIAKPPEPMLEHLRDEGFLEYLSKRKVKAHQVTSEDMKWFRHGNDTSIDKEEATHFIAPWGAPQLVEEGDYLVRLHNPQGKGNPEIYRIERVVFANTHKLTTMREQIEVQTYFGPMLKAEGEVFRKSASAFIRRAQKGEHIITAIDGKQESQNVVKDDTSWIVCGKVAGEYYILTQVNFDESYDASTAQPIEISKDTSKHLRSLHEQGYQEYKSKRQVRARQVTSNDMVWFGRSDTPDDSVAYFIAPWGEGMRVEEGDYLVMQHGGNNDEIYRIERNVFGETYERLVVSE